MQEILRQFVDLAYHDPLRVMVGLGMFAAAVMGSVYAVCRTTYLGWRALRWTFADTPPSELATAILTALDGTTHLAGDAVVAGSVTVDPQSCGIRIRVAGNDVDRFLTTAEKLRITSRAKAVQQPHRDRMRKEEVAALLAQVQTQTQTPAPSSPSRILSRW